MKGVLNNWEIAKFDRPGVYVIVGFLGNTEIRTSRILKLDSDKCMIETENSFYGLGTPKKG